MAWKKKDQRNISPEYRKPGEPLRRPALRPRNKEGRAHARSPRLEATHFSANRRLFEGTIRNLSAGGTYIQTHERFDVGQEVIVAGTFEEGGAEEKRYGKVVRYDSNGIGVQFVKRDPYLRR